MPEAESVVIAKMEYKLKSRTLAIWFSRGRGRRVFTGVPPEIFEQLLSAPKKAAFFDEHIAGRYAA
jgi:hypothetical protein